MTHDRSLDERYSVAVRSSNMAPSSADVACLTAAGLSHESLGVLLYRLAAEWDVAGGSYKLAAARAASPGAANMARTLARIGLRSLRDASAAMQRFAEQTAARNRWRLSARALRAVASKALRLWIDGICSECNGRSFVGGYHAPVVLCTACGATGRAMFALDKRDPHSPHVRALLSLMDAKTEAAARRMRRLLRAGSGRGQP